MPNQNRVNPFGDIIAAPGRGTFMGNRGVLHDERRKIRRKWKTRAWITCLLDFKNRRREVMSPNRYTELFFLDEAAAFAAGHRPCAECRYDDYRRFKELWIRANRNLLSSENPRIAELDAVIHQERIDENHSKITFRAPLSDLPDGVFIMLPNDVNFYLVWQNWLLQWTSAGYVDKIKPSGSVVFVLTPKSVVKTISAGYLPGIHESAKLLIV